MKKFICGAMLLVLGFVVSAFIIALTLLFMSGCSSNNDNDTVKNGHYIMEHDEDGSPLLPYPYVTISNNRISFTYNFLRCYLTIGSYTGFTVKVQFNIIRGGIIDDYKIIMCQHHFERPERTGRLL